MHLHRERVGVVERKADLREMFGKRPRPRHIVVGEKIVAREVHAGNRLQRVDRVLRRADAARADHGDLAGDGLDLIRRHLVEPLHRAEHVHRHHHVDGRVAPRVLPVERALAERLLHRSLATRRRLGTALRGGMGPDPEKSVADAREVGRILEPDLATRQRLARHHPGRMPVLHHHVALRQHVVRHALLRIDLDAPAQLRERLHPFAALEEKRPVVGVGGRGVRVGGDGAGIVLLRRRVVVLAVRQQVAHQDKPRPVVRIDAQALDAVVLRAVNIAQHHLHLRELAPRPRVPRLGLHPRLNRRLHLAQLLFHKVPPICAKTGQTCFRTFAHVKSSGTNSVLPNSASSSSSVMRRSASASSPYEGLSPFSSMRRVSMSCLSCSLCSLFSSFKVIFFLLYCVNATVSTGSTIVPSVCLRVARLLFISRESCPTRQGPCQRQPA